MLKSRNQIVAGIACFFFTVLSVDTISQKIEPVVSEGHGAEIVFSKTNAARNLLFTCDRFDKMIIWDVRSATKLGSADLSEHMSKYGSVLSVDFHSQKSKCLITTEFKALEYDILSQELIQIIETQKSMSAGFYFEDQYFFASENSLFSLHSESSNQTEEHDIKGQNFFKSDDDIFYTSRNPDNESSFELMIKGFRTGAAYNVDLGSGIQISRRILFDPVHLILVYTSIPEDESFWNCAQSIHIVDLKNERYYKSQIRQEFLSSYAISESGKYLLYPDAMKYCQVDPDGFRVFDLENFKELDFVKTDDDVAIANISSMASLNGNREILYTNANQIYRYDWVSNKILSEFPMLASSVSDAVIALDKVFISTHNFPNTTLSKFDLNNREISQVSYENIHRSSLSYFEEENLLAFYAGDFLEFYSPDTFSKLDSVQINSENEIWQYLRTFKSRYLNDSTVVCQNLRESGRLDYLYFDIFERKQIPTLRNATFSVFQAITDSTFIGLSEDKLGYFHNSNELPLSHHFLDLESDTVIAKCEINSSAIENTDGTSTISISDTTWTTYNGYDRILWDGSDRLRTIQIIYDSPGEYELVDYTKHPDYMFDPDYFDGIMERAKNLSERGCFEYDLDPEMVVTEYQLSPRMHQKAKSELGDVPRFLRGAIDKSSLIIEIHSGNKFNIKPRKKSQVLDNKMLNFESLLELDSTLVLRTEEINYEDALGDLVQYTTLNICDKNTYLFDLDLVDDPTAVEERTDISLGYFEGRNPSFYPINDTLMLLHRVDDWGGQFELYEFHKDSLWLTKIDDFKLEESDGINYLQFNHVKSTHVSQNKIIVSGYSGSDGGSNITRILNVNDPEYLGRKVEYNEETLGIIHPNNIKGKWNLTNAPGISSRFYFDLIGVQDATKELRVYYLNDKEWLFQNPENYYFGTPGALEYIRFKRGLEIFELEQFDLKFHRPDIILEELGHANGSLISAYRLAYEKRLKKLGFEEEMLSDDFHIPTINIENSASLPPIVDKASITLELKIQDTKYPLDRVFLWVNDVALQGEQGIKLNRDVVQKDEFDLEVNLSKGNNKIQVSVLNQVGAESYKETINIECTAGKDRPDLYLITIGASEYDSSDFNLTYASKDAEDMIKLFAQSKIHENVFTKKLVNEQTTRENVMALKSFLDRADINDEVMIFIAGHGVLDEHLDYYFATHDMNFEIPSKRGLLYEDLESLLDGIKPLKKLLLIDACHAGEVDKENVALVEENEETSEVTLGFRGIVRLKKKSDQDIDAFELMKNTFSELRRGTGATVISSSSGLEYAYESDEWNNGLFTYCFLNGIKTGVADLNSDGEIWLSEIQSYVAQHVSEMSNGAQRPTTRIKNLSADYRIW